MSGKLRKNPSQRRGSSHRSHQSRESGRSVPVRFSVAHMLPEVDPQEDFYRYATGKWLQRNPVPADKARWAGFDELVEQNYRLLRKILQEASTVDPKRATPDQRRVGDFYTAAMDWGRRNRLGLRPILADLEAIRGISSAPQVAVAFARFHRNADPTGFTVRSAPDWKHSERYALYLLQGGLSLPDREYYLAAHFAPVRVAFLNHIARLESLSGTPSGEARRQAKIVLSIETELASASRKREDLRDPLSNYHAFSRSRLSEAFDNLDWDMYFEELGVTVRQPVIVGQPEFFEGVNRMIHHRNLSEWKTYLAWRLLHGSAPFLDQKRVAEDFDFFHRKLLGQRTPEPSWREAARTIDRFIGESLGKLYVDRHFPPEARERIEELVEDIKTVFRDRLRNVPWMRASTRKEALRKFERFRTKIGHPKRFRSYAGLRIARQDFHGNVKRSAQFEMLRRLRRVGKRVDPTEWQMSPPTVNAYFQPSMNEIVFPAGILQPPFFDKDMDDAVNYGSIGVVIGHEITHGYDDQGRKFDARGNLRDWWGETDAAEFNARALRIIKQFRSYHPLPGYTINGKLTQGENIADLGGVSLAYEALERRLHDGRTPDVIRDGFTPRQRFFIAYAQTWRENIRAELLQRLLTTDPHSPGAFRAIGPLSNFPPFWEAFHVPEGARMRLPESKRCEIW